MTPIEKQRATMTALEAIAAVYRAGPGKRRVEWDHNHERRVEGESSKALWLAGQTLFTPFNTDPARFVPWEQVFAALYELAFHYTYREAK
jgi:hypothetical protein